MKHASHGRFGRYGPAVLILTYPILGSPSFIASYRLSWYFPSFPLLSTDFLAISLILWISVVILIEFMRFPSKVLAFSHFLNKFHTILQIFSFFWKEKQKCIISIEKSAFYTDPERIPRRISRIPSCCYAFFRVFLAFCIRHSSS